MLLGRCRDPDAALEQLQGDDRDGEQAEQREDGGVDAKHVTLPGVTAHRVRDR